MSTEEIQEKLEQELQEVFYYHASTIDKPPSGLWNNVMEICKKHGRRIRDEARKCEGDWHWQQEGSMCDCEYNEIVNVNQE